MLPTDWEQLASLMMVLGGLCTVVQIILIRLVIQPQIEKSTRSTVVEFKLWADERFPAKAQFDLHDQMDKVQHQRLAQIIGDLIADQAKDNERLASLHDKVLILSGKIKD